MHGKHTLLVLLLLAIPLAGSAGAGSVGISEVLYDAVGADGGKTFVELYGDSHLKLDGYSLAGVNGSDGKTYLTIDLKGMVIPSDGFLVIADLVGGSTSVANADYTVSNIDLQNGPDSLRLLSGATVVDALGYGDPGASGTFAGEGSAAKDVSAGSSLARIYANVDSDDNAKDFDGLLKPTPGTGSLKVVAVPTPEAAALTVVGLALVGLHRRVRRHSRKQ